MRVLVVDDEPDILALLTEMLTTLGHEPVAATSGVAAWALFEQAPARVIIVDWRMPGLDGLELVKRIRAATRTRYSYVLVLTALSGTERYLEAMAGGADDFITKPISVDELRARLRVAERIIGLQQNVKLLEGLLSVCMYCKSVRVSETTWTSIERYIEERSDASFSHDVCPSCFEQRVKPLLDASND